MKKILVTGAFGQIGSELVPVLQQRYGKDLIIASDIRISDKFDGQSEILNVMDTPRVADFVKKNDIGTIYHLASLLSVAGEKDPELAWNLNLGSLKSILDIAKEHKIKVFWPSSIAAFGPTSILDHAPQHNILEPTTMYGVTKVAGELLCQYYNLKYGVDTRSVRYPGIIQYKADIADGTTEYACAIFYDALRSGKFQCFLKEDTALPMMFIDDAIEATIKITESDPEKIQTRTSYNLAAISFSPSQLAEEINKHIPLTVIYKPDHHQDIADTWPPTIDDSHARGHWGWQHQVDLPKTVEIMLNEIAKKIGVKYESRQIHKAVAR